MTSEQGRMLSPGDLKLCPCVNHNRALCSMLPSSLVPHPSDRANGSKRWKTPVQGHRQINIGA